MDRLLAAGAEQLVIGMAFLACLIAVAAYVIGRAREKTLQKEPPASQLLSKFRELHSQGDLDDAEFRTIKTALSVELREELKGNEEKG